MFVMKKMATLIFAVRKLANAPAIKNMMVASVTVVVMNTTSILIALIVNASQTTPKMLLMFVTMKMVTVHAERVTLADNVMNVKKVTLVILIADPVVVNLVTQLELYVTSLMENACV